MARQRPFTIDVINKKDPGEQFKSNYDFLPDIRLPSEVENEYSIIGVSEGSDGPFKEWLKGIGDKLPKEELVKTTYLKEVV